MHVAEDHLDVYTTTPTGGVPIGVVGECFRIRKRGSTPSGYPVRTEQGVDDVGRGGDMCDLASALTQGLGGGNDVAAI